MIVEQDSGGHYRPRFEPSELVVLPGMQVQDVPAPSEQVVDGYYAAEDRKRLRRVAKELRHER